MKADAYLDRHNKPKRQVQIRTVSGEVLYMRPGVAPVVDLPNLELDMTRVLVERSTTTVGAEGDTDHPDVTLALQCTAGEWESLAADYWRGLVRLRNPPRTRVSLEDDPNQILIAKATCRWPCGCLSTLAVTRRLAGLALASLCRGAPGWRGSTGMN